LQCKTLRKSARFRVGDVAFRLKPYPPHYRAAFASCAILCPHCQQIPLRFICSKFPFERQYGFTTFPACHTTGLGSASPPVAWWRTYPYLRQG